MNVLYEFIYYLKRRNYMINQYSYVAYHKRVVYLNILQSDICYKNCELDSYIKFHGCTNDNKTVFMTLQWVYFC